MEVITAIVYVIVAFIIYKLLDRIVRIPKVGKLGDKYILVTGCDTGFGYEISKRLDQMGCHVFAACLTDKGETELRKQCSSRLKTISMNVAKSVSVQKAYAEVEKALPKGTGLWGIINNAGIAGNIGPAEWLTLKDYQQVFDVNLLGLVDVTVTFLPLIKRRGGGRIVNTASIFGRCSLVGSTPYCISKYGVESFSDSLRRQLRMYKISVHLIEPGFHKTNITACENLERGLRNSFNQAPEAIKQEYGKQFLEKSIDVALKTFVSSVISEKISDVVDVYEHALLGMFPRARYVVGNDAKFVFLPLNYCMPEWLGDYLLERLGGKDGPKPTCITNGTYGKM